MLWAITFPVWKSVAAWDLQSPPAAPWMILLSLPAVCWMCKTAGWQIILFRKKTEVFPYIFGAETPPPGFLEQIPVVLLNFPTALLPVLMLYPEPSLSNPAARRLIRLFPEVDSNMCRAEHLPPGPYWKMACSISCAAQKLPVRWFPPEPGKCLPPIHIGGQSLL